MMLIEQTGSSQHVEWDSRHPMADIYIDGGLRQYRGRRLPDGFPQISKIVRFTPTWNVFSDHTLIGPG